MKKIDDNKIINNEEPKLKEDKGIAITCDCCEDEEREEERHQPQTRYNVFLNEKLLIVIGLSLTIPLVLLQIFSDSYAINLLSLAFATPVQILLGRPFYLRFIGAIIHNKGFTTDTLVVLSTTVAYIYSLINVTSGSHVQFFEASSSVLTIFTIGEYLESRILKTTSESLRNLLALKPKSAVVIRNGGKEEVIDADDIVIGDTVVTKPGEKIATDGI